MTRVIESKEQGDQQNYGHLGKKNCSRILDKTCRALGKPLYDVKKAGDKAKTGQTDDFGAILRNPLSQADLQPVNEQMLNLVR